MGMNNTTHKILSLTETCSGCFACANICPNDAISLPTNFEGFYFPIIDQGKCINCGLCDRVCPQLTEMAGNRMQRAFYGWSNDDAVRKASSSGGIFYALANQILIDGGIVYGAAFNYEGTVRLECHSTEDVSLKELMRSKYVQNHIGYAFRRIKADLKNGKKVLYCATPCQIAGLKSYLGRIDCSQLITVDFICHGVPSMDLLQKHLEYLGINNIQEINFRPKNRGWVDDFEISYKKNPASPDIKCRRIPWRYDEYYNTFEKYCSIRRSCRNCLYSQGVRASDLTIADFWGVKEFNPSLWDARGISLILANTERGVHLVNNLDAGNCSITELPLQYAEYVYTQDRRAPESSYQDKRRDSFLNAVYTIGYKKALKMYGFKVKKYDLYKYHIQSLLLKFKNNVIYSKKRK